VNSKQLIIYHAMGLYRVQESSGKKILQHFALAGCIRLGYFTPQLRPANAIAPRKSRLERKLQGERVAGTQHVITLINSHVMIRHSTIWCMSVSRGRKSTTAIRLERKVALAIAPRNCTSQLHLAIAPRNSYLAPSGMDSTSALAPRNCTSQLRPASLVWKGSNFLLLHPLGSVAQDFLKDMQLITKTKHEVCRRADEFMINDK
jgi:hypothetical protein